MSEHSRVFTSRSADCYLFSFFEEVVGNYSVVDFLFKDIKEAFFADSMAILRPFDSCIAFIS